MALSIPLNPGKIFRPPLPVDHLPRPELIGLLNKARQRRLILVCAPAGFGKSTLAIEYCQQLDAPWRSAWVSLDGRDGQPAQFLRTLVDALATLYPQLGEADLALLQQHHSQQPLDVEQRAVSILSELRARHAEDQPLVLVLDDYHLVQSPPCDRLCALLLEHLPGNIQLFITSRQKPDWHLARLRLSHQLLELGEEHLRLSNDEARLFLEQAGLDLADPEWTRQALQRNEGWIAGLRLLSVAAEQQSRPLALPLSGPLVDEYLLEEVILRQPEPVRVFLHEIAWLDRFCVELCDSVRDASDSLDIITHLLRHHVFLVPLDNDGTWYRFHHLFSDVLRERVARDDPRQRLRTHLRACHWFGHQGRISDAVEHALAAERPEEAASLVQNLSLDQLLAEQHVGTLLRWKAELPSVLQGSSARLVLVHGWTLALACQLEDAEAMLARLSRFLPQANADRQRRVLGQALVLKGFLARAAGRLDEADHLSHQALACLDERDPGSRLMAMLTLADVELCRGHHEAARHWARSALELAQRAGDPLLEAQVVFMRARLLQARGQVGRALQLLERHSQELERMDYPEGLAVRARLRLYRGYLLEQQGDMAMALRLLDSGIEEGRRCRDVYVLMGYCVMGSLLTQQREVTRAFDVLTEAERLMHLWDIPPIYYLGWVTAIKSELWMHSERLDLAAHWLPRLRQTYCLESPAAPPPFFHALASLIEQIHAGLLWYRGEQVAAESLMRRLLSQLQHNGEKLRALSVQLHLLRMLFRTQRQAEAEQLLFSALVQAADDHLAGPFMRLIDQAPAGLAEALRRAPASALRDQLLERLPGVSGPDGRRINAALREPLSSRELDVLRCIAQGYSNQQISEALFISLHTVKSHARRINHKLGVSRRTQAVAQAKVLGLLG
ncbi:helix-turn-helix transcriptional regulator [Pseudomonas sp. WN033]|nr:helix-turn-helix transcriptional regulator [Pseudomonas sp. WN033]